MSETVQKNSGLQQEHYAELERVKNENQRRKQDLETVVHQVLSGVQGKGVYITVWFPPPLSSIPPWYGKFSWKKNIYTWLHIEKTWRNISIQIV